MEIANLLLIAFAFGAGSAVTWLVMDRARLAARIQALEDQASAKEREAWEDWRYRIGKHNADMLQLARLAARDTIDLLHRAAPHEVTAILRELGILRLDDLQD